MAEFLVSSSCIGCRIQAMDSLPSSAMALVLEYIGSHVLGEVVWGRHWNPVDHFGMHVGQSRGCCRAANPEDWGSDCESCVDLWFARLTSEHMSDEV